MGLSYLTRDAGKTWSNVTPPDMPSLIRVSLIDASPHKAGAAYVAAKNYLQDDRAPYIWKTDDYGKTWKKIISGIAAGDFVHAVREDLKRPGLLYAGTEHGFYVSFDDGDHWQSLSLNLPDTQVSDIALAPHDVVISTMGRGFYSLTNMDVLREFTPTVAQTQELHVFTPINAVRRSRPLIVDYYLPAAAEKVSIEILNAKGSVIDTYNGPPAERGRAAAAAVPTRRRVAEVAVSCGQSRPRLLGSIGSPGICNIRARQPFRGWCCGARTSRAVPTPFQAPTRYVLRRTGNRSRSRLS